MRAKKCSNKSSNPQNQRGVALLILLLIFGAGAMYVLLRGLNQSNLQIERDKITERALAQAKEALIGYAISRPLNSFGISVRPGDLPCPDMNNDGSAEGSCGNASGSTGQSNRLGRLPWKTLNLPDLRDGYGERLWYAVSNNFKNNSRHMPLNSNIYGTITVRNNVGNIIHDGSLPSAALAVIFSAGPPLKRENSTSTQDRSCNGGTNCAEAPCTVSSGSPNCNPRNYLDSALGEDNADFVDSNNNNGFILGEIRDNQRNVIVNDRLVVISYEELMPRIEQRVAAEARDCLIIYAARANNAGRYPWAVNSANLSYGDEAGRYFGRFPMTMDATRSTSANMENTWAGADCSIISGAPWWVDNQWNELVFYSVAPAFAPLSPAAPPSCGSCLTVSKTGQNLGGKQFVIALSGRALNGQSRTTSAQKQLAANFLEAPDIISPNQNFLHAQPTNSFNDQVQSYP
jgi:hypothetical protein